MRSRRRSCEGAAAGWKIPSRAVYPGSPGRPLPSARRRATRAGPPTAVHTMKGSGKGNVLAMSRRLRSALLVAVPPTALALGCPTSPAVAQEAGVELALWLLESDPAWSPQRVDRAMEAGREETARLSRPVPVHLLYWTAFADDDGTVQFRPDVYARDRPVAEALERDPPASGAEEGRSSGGGAQSDRSAATDGPSQEPTREDR